MEIINQNGPAFRTKCLPLDRAARFARCLSANASRFAVTGIEESRKAKGEARFFVVFAPVNPDRLIAIAARQQDQRAERSAAEGADYLWSQDESGRWAWVFNPLSGETYEVSEHNCTCPDFHYRCEACGLACKHMIAYRQAVAFGDLAPDQQARDAESGDEMRLVEFDPNFCIDCDAPLQPSEKESGICLGCWSERRQAEALNALREAGEDAERACAAEWGSANGAGL